MTLAILGGTFNPIHLGHLYLADELGYQFGYTTVLVVPAYIPPHKRVEGDIEPRRRVDMIRIAIEDIPGMRLDTCEIDRGGVSFSIDTVRSVMERYDLESKPGLVIGDDLAAGFDNWRDARLLSDTADIVLAHRSTVGRVPFDYPHRYLDNLLVPFSSTDIRLRIRESRPFRAMVPSGVYRYITEEKLYRD